MTIGPYTVLERLGQGAFSIVFRARAPDGRTVALKVLDENEHDEETVERFLREARIATRLVDDALPRIHDIGAEGTRHYIAMELIEGTPLDELLRARGSLEPAAVANLAVQLARALSAAHAIGIVHRDIKPANVLVTDGGALKLLDFGLSHMVGLQSISAPGVLIGTVPYMSPEQLLGELVDPRSDVFSASAVFYELLAGARPFPGDRFENVSHAILNVPPERLVDRGIDVPEAIERVIFKGLMKRPEDRYPSADVLLQDWQRVAEDPAGVSMADLAAEAGVLAPAEPTAYASMVGRTSALERLDRLLETIAPDGGRIVSVVGDAGMGKSRLLEAMGERARTRQIEVIEARCAGGRGTRAYQAWADLVERYTGRRGAASPESVRELLGTMGLGVRARMLDVFLRIDDAGLDTPAMSTRGLWESLLAFWRKAAATRPLLLVIDNLHLADPPTLEFLGYVAANLRGVPVVIACGHRSDLASARQELADAVAEARRSDRLVECPVGALTIGDVEALVTSRFGRLEGGDALAARMMAESDGNPLYIVEALKLLEAEGRLVETAAGWTLVADLQDIPIPEQIVDLVRQRLARVTDQDRELLDAAAVAGDMFPAKALADCFETTQLSILRRLRRLEQVNGIVTSTEEGFRFVQSKIREIVLEGVSGELRTEYHRTIASTYVAMWGDDEKRTPEIAEHLVEAGELTAAAPYLERAGDRSFRLFANDAALDAYERSMDILDDVDAEAEVAARCRLRRKIISVEIRLSRLEEAVLTGAVALRLARRAEDTSESGEVLLLLAEAYTNRGDDARALETVRNARKAFEAAGCEEAIARTLDHEGKIRQRQGRLDEALELYRKALACREKLSLNVATAHSYYRIGSVLKRQNRYDESLAELLRARDVLEASGDRVTAASASGEMGIVHFLKEEYGLAGEEFERCLSVMREAGERRRLAIALTNAGTSALFGGDPGRAESLYLESLSIRLDIGDEPGIGTVQSNLAQVFRYVARYRDAVLAAHDGVEFTREREDLTHFAEAVTQTGWICMELGELVAARGWAERALAVYRDMPHGGWRMAARRLQLAEIALAAGDLERAEHLRRQAGETSGDAWVHYDCEERLLRADLLREAGDVEGAAHLAEEAFRASSHADVPLRTRAETRALVHGVAASGEVAARAAARIPAAITRVRETRFRGLELMLRIALARYVARGDKPSGLDQLRLALEVADRIMPDVPSANLSGWAARWGYHEALGLARDWSRATGDVVILRDAESRRELLERRAADGTFDPTMTGSDS